MRPKLRASLKALFLSLGFGSPEAFAETTNAEPTGGQVTAGQASINQVNPNTVEINQTSNKAIIQWQTFDVAKGNTVDFVTPGASAVTLNRVDGNSASDIDGTVTSNGQLWIINPNGVIFGQDAQVNTAGLLASTLNISNQNFLNPQNGNYNFSQPNGTASILNQGNLSSSGGYVSLLAPQIANTGVVAAKLGTVALGAGTQATVTFQGNRLLQLAVPQGAAIPMYDSSGNPVAALTNRGRVEADGGEVLMSAASVDTLLDESINVSGIIVADTVNDIGGNIVLTSSHQTILQDATINAQGLNAGQTGGNVEILGQDVGVFGNTSINASGAAGGGQIHVGWDSEDPNAVEAQETIIDPNVILNASATQQGNGGFIETSGDYLVEASTNISTAGAGTGSVGMFLMDPYDVDIVSGSSVSGGSFSNGTFTPDGSTDPAQVGASEIDTLLGTTNVTITTTGDGSDEGNITVESSINSTSSHNLTLQAVGSITVNSGVTVSVGKSLILDAGGSGAGNIDIEGTLESGTESSGAITLNAYNYGTTDSTGTITLGSAGEIELGSDSSSTSTMEAGAGITFDTGSTITALGAGAINITADENNSATGGINALGTITAAHNVQLTDDSTAFLAGDVAINLGGDINSGNHSISVTATMGDIEQTNGLLTSTTVTLNSSDGNVIQQTSAGINASTLTIEAGDTSSGVGSMDLIGTNNENISTINVSGNVNNSATAFSLYDGGITSSLPVINNGTNAITYSSFSLNLPNYNSDSDTDLASFLDATVFYNETNPATFDVALNLPAFTGTISLGDNADIDPSQENAQEVDSVSLTTAGPVTLTGFASDDDLNSLTVTTSSQTSESPISITGTIAASGDITVSASGDITQNADTTLSSNDATTANTGINITATDGNITQSGTMTTAGSAITLSAEGDFTQSSTGTITAGSGSSWGNITVSTLGFSTGSTGTLTQDGTVEGNDLTLNATSGNASPTSSLLQNGSLISHDSTSGNAGVGLYISNGLDITQSSDGTITTQGADVFLGNNSVLTGETITQGGSVDTDGGDVEFSLGDTGTITQNSTGSITANQVELFLANNATADLNGANNSFSEVAVDNTSTPTSPISVALDVTDQDDLAFGLFYNDSEHPPSSPDSFSSLTINTSGNITRATTDDDGDTSENLTVTGTTNLDAGVDNIGSSGTPLTGNFGDASVTLDGDNIYLTDTNTTGLKLGSVDSSGNVTLHAAGGISQTGALSVTGTTSLTAADNIVLTNTSNSFTGNVTTVGDNVSLVDSGTLKLEEVDASGNVTLAAEQLDNVGGSDAITTGAGDAWQIYLTNLSGNTFDGLASGNQAIWGTSYGTSISQSGNRYIFGTTETLNLTPELTPFAVTKAQGTTANFPAPTAGTNVQASGFVNASSYGNVFTQDTNSNINFSGLSFTSAGAPVSAAAGTYDVTLTGAGTSTGYATSYNNTAEFGELTVTPASSGTGNEAAANPGVAGDTVNQNIQSNSDPVVMQNNHLHSLMGQKNCRADAVAVNCGVTKPAGMNVQAWLNSDNQIRRFLSPRQLLEYRKQVQQQCTDSAACTVKVVVDSKTNGASFTVQKEGELASVINYIKEKID